MSLIHQRIIYRSEKVRELLGLLQTVAKTNAELLLTGESGVGKELFAEFAHSRSQRAQRAFVTLNCANLTGDLFENELFGHVRGAFTGAHTEAHGLVRMAERGTLFFDEVDALQLASQAKLLRFVQNKEYRRLGESHLRHADTRIIAASNSDLEARVGDGGFRQDLFFRLRVVPIEIPPLRERPEDIAPLIEHFAERYAAEYGVPRVTFTRAALNRLESYTWPGNVRELENCVRSLSCRNLGRPADPEDLPLLGRPQIAAADEETSRVDEVDLLGRPLKSAKANVVEKFEQAYVTNALEQTNGNVTEAARQSGKHRRAFFELMRKYGLKACDFRPGA